MIRSVEMKLYPTDAQAETLTAWMRACCWIYNRSLEHRIKSYKRRKKSVSFFAQTALLTKWRKRMPSLAAVAVEFERDAMRRVGRAYDAFFRRVKAGERPGFPRFKSFRRYNSMECLIPLNYVRATGLHIPVLGTVKFRAGRQSFDGRQRSLRIINRAGTWFAQIVLDDGKTAPVAKERKTQIGVDVGLSNFASLSNGEQIDNPRFFRVAQRRLKTQQQRLARCKRGSRNRRKAVSRVAAVHQRTKSQRRDFCHQISRSLVNRFDLIAIEKLNIKGLARTRLAKSIHDAAWGMLINFTTYKAANAGAIVKLVDPRGTSQECPECGNVKRKKLSERVHACSVCGIVIDRDVSAARVILARARGSSPGVLPVESMAAVTEVIPSQANSVKQEDFYRGLFHG